MNEAALRDLNQFTGTEQYYKLPLVKGLVYTDGVRHLAQNADCYWLIDEIAFAQALPAIKDNARLQEHQFWTLTPDGKGGAKLEVEEDEGEPVWSKKIPYTDFPFQATGGNIRIWVAPTFTGEVPVQVAYLPSEH